MWFLSLCLSVFSACLSVSDLALSGQAGSVPSTEITMVHQDTPLFTQVLGPKLLASTKLSP